MTATDERRGADRARDARVTGSLLLLVELLRRARDRRALLLGRRRARRLLGELRLHDFVEEVLLDLGPEDLVREVDACRPLALQENIDGR